MRLFTVRQWTDRYEPKINHAFYADINYESLASIEKPRTFSKLRLNANNEEFFSAYDGFWFDNLFWIKDEEMANKCINDLNKILMNLGEYI